jgi:capsular polysaccharide biosynthesis protein
MMKKAVRTIGVAMKSGPLTVPSRAEMLAGSHLVCLERAGLWTRAAAHFVVDLSGAHLKHGLSAEQPNRWHASYRNCFSDVLLFGHHFFHGILSRSGRIDSQSIDGMRRLLDTHLCYHPGRDFPMPQIYRTKDGYRINCKGIVPQRLEGVHYFGTPIEPLNWGMWLLQAIPSAIDFLSRAEAEKLFIHMSQPWQRRMLNALGIPDERLVHQELGHTYHCSDLILKQYSDIDLAPTPMEREIFARVARDVGGLKDVKASRRLFLSRRSITKETKGIYRALVNEAALIRALKARGYEIVEPELLSFPDQIRLFSEAELVVGLGGAGMFNVIFCPPGTRVVTIESSLSFVHAHACLFGALGHPFGVIFGKEDLDDVHSIHKRWTVSVKGVLEALKQYE